MDNPFSADKNNPFQTPYQATPPSAPIKPFTAVDLAPAGQNGTRLGTPATPAPSPFAGGDFGSAFLTREAPAARAPQQAPAVHAPVPVPAAPLADPFASITPVSAPLQDFSPAPMAPGPAARQSQILAISEFNETVVVRKPDFFCTSTHGVDGYAIRKYLGVVSVEIVIPKDVLFHNPAAYGELHRIKSAEDQLQKVKAKAFEELSERARLLGADGVVGVGLNFSQFDAIVCLCSAVGTAVKLAD
ncbi:MAG TPA: heavy metal-binding domain-containing protein [Fibrobacteria bacterium]|nr:heavy metal-binding domain-containing protein [Fibrobacteria bacterium]